MRLRYREDCLEKIYPRTLGKTFNLALSPSTVNKFSIFIRIG